MQPQWRLTNFIGVGGSPSFLQCLGTVFCPVSASATEAYGQLYLNPIMLVHLAWDILYARTIRPWSPISSQSVRGGRTGESYGQRAWSVALVLRIGKALRREYKVAEGTVADLICSCCAKATIRRFHDLGGTTGTPPVVLGPLDSCVGISIDHGENPPLQSNRPIAGKWAATARLGSGFPGPIGGLSSGCRRYPGRQPHTTQYPLDEPPVWSYAAKDALRSPKVEAVVSLERQSKQQRRRSLRLLPIAE